MRLLAILLIFASGCALIDPETRHGNGVGCQEDPRPPVDEEPLPPGSVGIFTPRGWTLVGESRDRSAFEMKDLRYFGTHATITISLAPDEGRAPRQLIESLATARREQGYVIGNIEDSGTRSYFRWAHRDERTGWRYGKVDVVQAWKSKSLVTVMAEWPAEAVTQDVLCDLDEVMFGVMNAIKH